MAKNAGSGRKGRRRGGDDDRAASKPDAPKSRGRRDGTSTDDASAPKKTRRERAQDRRQAVKPGGQSKSQTGSKKEGRGGFVRFVGECVSELRKVDWPGQKQLLAATIAVLVAVAVVGVFLYAADEALSRLVRDVLLAG